MFFKNLIAYRLKPNWNVTLDSLNERLGRGPFVACQSNEPLSRGWVSPVKDGALAYSVGGQWLISLKIQERILPSAVVNDEVTERAEALEATQGYRPGRKQMKELKERVTEELLPRAFTKNRSTFAWIDPVNGWLVIDATTATKGEALIEHLRHCLDDFPLSMLHTQISAATQMAGWLTGGEAPQGFTVDRDCELCAAGEEKSAVAYKHHSLGDEISEEIKAHIAAGKLPTRLAMTWDDRVSFVLTDKLEIRRLAFLDLLKQENESQVENADEQFDADFALMTGELQRFLGGIVEALGGEVVEQE